MSPHARTSVYSWLGGFVIDSLCAVEQKKAKKGKELEEKKSGGTENDLRLWSDSTSPPRRTLWMGTCRDGCRSRLNKMAFFLFLNRIYIYIYTVEKEGESEKERERERKLSIEKINAWIRSVPEWKKKSTRAFPWDETAATVNTVCLIITISITEISIQLVVASIIRTYIIKNDMRISLRIQPHYYTLLTVRDWFHIFFFITSYLQPAEINIILLFCSTILCKTVYYTVYISELITRTHTHTHI